jgi:hypothetical protein
MALFKPDLVLRANFSVARPYMGCEDGDCGKAGVDAAPPTRVISSRGFSRPAGSLEVEGT